ncbi:hypothetical protein U9M48_009214 [Paspalum notatum var. saurae]|uniref:Uncharacterized protein n=1 Tax=Paspalum notatum var. saurae TaxID=547442 RepID=A0AAQ3SRW0_PASNO
MSPTRPWTCPATTTTTTTCTSSSPTAGHSFNVDSSLYMNDSTGVAPSVHPEWQPVYFGEAVTVNGKAWPFLAVHRRRYRLHILNASNAR